METFHQIDVLTQARRNRLHLAFGIIPGMMWMVLVVGGSLTVGFTFFFGTENLLGDVPAGSEVPAAKSCIAVPIENAASRVR